MTRPVLHKLGAAAEANGRPIAIYSMLDVLDQARIDHVMEKLPRRVASLHDKGVWLPQRRHHHDRTSTAA